MDHFLVDYENIGEAGLNGIENLSADTSTIIFYSEHADKISFDMHQILSRCRSKLEFRKAETGKKNALDFQLSTYLGYLVASHPGDRFYIISKDNGYRVVMDFWNKNNIQQIDYIGRAYEKPTAETSAVTVPAEKTIALPEEVKEEAPVPAPNETRPETEKHMNRNSGRRRNQGHRDITVEEKPSEELMNELAQLIDSEEERENIGRFIVKYKTKQGVNNAIVKIYGTEKAGELYKKIKPLLKDKKGK